MTGVSGCRAGGPVFVIGHFICQVFSARGLRGGRGVAGLEDDVPPNSQGFARFSCTMSSAAFASSPSEVKFHVS